MADILLLVWTASKNQKATSQFLKIESPDVKNQICLEFLNDFTLT